MSTSHERDEWSIILPITRTFTRGIYTPDRGITLTPSRPVSAIPILVAMRALPDLITFMSGLKFPSAILSPGMTYLLFISCIAQKLTTRAKNPSESIFSFFIISFSLLWVVGYSALIFLSVDHRLICLYLGRPLCN